MPLFTGRVFTGRVVAASATVVALLAVAGCAPPTVACPAIAYFSTLHVTLDGEAVADVTGVEICHQDECGPTTDTGSTLSLITGTGEGGDWTFVGHFPEGFSVRVHGGDGATVLDAEIDPEWVRTGGSEECGGPMEASVTLGL